MPMTLSYTSKNEATAYVNVTQDLDVLSKWCEVNQLTVNIKKTKLALFGTKEMLKKALYIDMFMGDEKLQYVNNFVSATWIPGRRAYL